MPVIRLNLWEARNMNNRALLRTGIIGTVVAALCCFTPVLVILFGAVGLAAWVGYLDYLLLPALVFFISLTVYALTRRNRGQCKDISYE